MRLIRPVHTNARYTHLLFLTRADAAKWVSKQTCYIWTDPIETPQGFWEIKRGVKHEI